MFDTPSCPGIRKLTKVCSPISFFRVTSTYGTLFTNKLIQSLWQFVGLHPVLSSHHPHSRVGCAHSLCASFQCVRKGGLRQEDGFSSAWQAGGTFRRPQLGKSGLCIARSHEEDNLPPADWGQLPLVLPANPTDVNFDNKHVSIGQLTTRAADRKALARRQEPNESQYALHGNVHWAAGPGSVSSWNFRKGQKSSSLS